LDESDFISLLRNKNESGFKELVDTYSNKVFNTVLGFVQNREDAEDISQEVFIDVYRSVENFKGDSKFSTWIYRIAVNKSLDHLKAKKRSKRFAFVQSLFSGEDTNLSTDVPHFEHPGVILENKEHAKVLFYAISKIPENQRTAFTLHKVEGLNYTEISDIMEVSISSVESLMFRAKQNLKEILKNYYENNF